MASPQKPKAWNLSPQMTAAPELWRGGAVLYPNWCNGPIRPIGGDSSVKNHTLALKSNPGYQLVPKGGAFYFDRVNGSNGDGAQAEPVSKVPFPTGKTGESLIIHTFFRMANASPDDLDVLTVFGCNPSSGNNGDGFWLRMEKYNAKPGDTYQPYLRTFGSNNGGDLTQSSVVTGGEDHLVSVAWDVGQGYDVYVDGKLATTTVNSDAGSKSSTYSIEMGSSSDGAGNFNHGGRQPFDGWIYYAYVRSQKNARNNIANEAKWLYSDPFAMLRPAGF